jgi:hypothetical protein
MKPYGRLRVWLAQFYLREQWTTRSFQKKFLMLPPPHQRNGAGLVTVSAKLDRHI